MSLPETDPGAYNFEEDDVLIPNDPTKKTFYDSLAENTDYLKTAKMWGFNGNNDDSANRTSRPDTSFSTTGTIGLGTGFFHVIKEIPEWSSEPTVLIKASEGLPDDAYGFRYKMLTLNLRMLVTQTNSTSDPWSFIPGGLQDDVLASNKPMEGESSPGEYDGDEQHTFNPEFLYTGAGIDPNIPPSWANGYIQEWNHQFSILPPTASIDIFMWVAGSGTDNPGDLMCVVNEIQGLHYYNQYLIVLTGFYSPMWIEI